MGNADASEHARMAAQARWGDRVLQRSAAVVLERGTLPDDVRDVLERIAGGTDDTKGGGEQ